MEDRIFIQVIKFEDLVKFVKQATYVGSMTVYQMPNKASDYVSDLSNLTENLIKFAGDEQWRIKKEHNVPVRVTENDDGIIVGNDVLLMDTAVVYAMTDINSFIIVPGEQSVKSLNFNPSTVLQFSNLVSMKPLLMSLEKYPIDEEKGIWGLDVVFKGDLKKS